MRSPPGPEPAAADPAAADAGARPPRRSPSAVRPRRPSTARSAPLNDADAAAVDALPAGSALLVVQRGPSAGSRFLLDTDVVAAGRHPDSEIFLDDVTVSRRHAEFRRGPEGFTVADVGSLNGTYVNRDRIDEVALQGGDEVQIGKYRLVFFASHAGAGSAGDRGRSAAGAATIRAARMSIGEVLEQLRPDFPDSTSPRSATSSPRDCRAGADAVGLPQVLGRRRRAAALRPHGPARALPAAEGDPRAPRRDGPRARAAGPADDRPAGAAGRAVRRRAAHPRRRSRPDGAELRLSRASCVETAEIDEDLLDQLERFGLVRMRPGTKHYDGDALVIAQGGGGARGVRPRAAAPARLQDRRRPRGRARRAGRRPDPCASATPGRRPAPRRRSARSPRSRCGCTPPW